MKKIAIILALFLIQITVISQDNGSAEGKVRFYHPNGKLASEGVLRDGKPDGYWRTYGTNGVLRSEGNRSNFELDSLWKFYSEEAELILEINYKDGKKHGIRRTIKEDEVIEENFVEDVKQGTTTHYYPDMTTKKTVEYENGLEHGISREYDENSNLIALIEYRRGFVVNQEFINRYDNQGRKNGVWKEFWDTGNLKSEVAYRRGLKNGYLKEYDRDGRLTNVEKYVNDMLVVDAKEVALYEIRYDYYPNGSVKVVGSYRDNVAQGIRKEFNPDGSVAKSYIMHQGYVIAEGILDSDNKKQGDWKEYYENGVLRAEGKYKDNIRVGEWNFHFPNGKLEQHGIFLNNGLPDGKWVWYYVSGNTRKEEIYEDGLENGEYAEYDEKGEVIIKGNYSFGRREGKWILRVNEYNEVGEFFNDVKEGVWKSFYDNDIPYTEGNFIDGLPDGTHNFYWENGELYKTGRYEMGVKQGNWRYYNNEGQNTLIVTYRNGVEHSYNNKLIEPELPDGTL